MTIVNKSVSRVAKVTKSAKGDVLYVPIGGAKMAATPKKTVSARAVTQVKNEKAPISAKKKVTAPMVAVLKQPNRAAIATRKQVSREDALDFLTKAGILDAKGQLKPIFR